MLAALSIYCAFLVIHMIYIWLPPKVLYLNSSLTPREKEEIN